MEKYRKFADEKNGINPFINSPKLKRKTIIHKLIQIPLSIIATFKFIAFIILFSLYSMIQFIKDICFFRFITRPIETLLCKSFSFVFLLLLGVFNYNPKKNQKIDLKSDKKTIIISSQSNIIDWCALMYHYSPKFVVPVKYDNRNNRKEKDEDLLISLNYFEVLKYSIGIKINTYKNKEEKQVIKNSSNYFNLEKQITESSDNTPIVIFPEATKTTREASLKIRSNVMDLIYKLIKSDKVQVLCHVSIYKNEYFNINNTTETKGFVSLFNTLSQLYNVVEYQVVLLNKNNFNMEIIDKSVLRQFSTEEEYYDSLVQENLTDPSYRNNRCNLDALDCISFLEFYKQTSTNTNYVKKDS